jgi:hypothetical protein
METTSLYVELLIIGFEVCAWLGLLLAKFSSAGRLSSLPQGVGNFALLATLLLFGVAYLLGIVFDKIAHFFFGAQRHYLESVLKGDVSDQVAKEEETDHRQIYARLMVKEGRAASEVLYGRSKVRILRASVINVPLIAVAAAVFLDQLEAPGWWLSLLVGLVFWAIILSTYVHTQRLYWARLQRFKRYLDAAGGGCRG